MNIKEENLLTLKQTADFLGIATNNLLYYVDKLKLLQPKVTLGGRRYFDRLIVESWRKPIDRRTLPKKNKTKNDN